jgi:hypothetical protein
MKSFSPSPLRRAVSSGHDEDANGPTGSSDMEWNSDMTEPESDDEEATRKFEMARDRTLARRARNPGLRTQGPPQDEIPDTPDQVEDSQVRLESTDVQTIPSPTPDSPPQPFEVRPTGRPKRKSSGSPGPMKRLRSTPPGTVEDTRTLLDQTESQKHEAALAMRNALHIGAGAMSTASNNTNSGTTASRARATGAAGGRGRGRGRGKSVW